MSYVFCVVVVCSEVLEEVKQRSRVVEGGCGESVVRVSVRDVVLERRVREASKPLYLKRYE